MAPSVHEFVVRALAAQAAREPGFVVPLGQKLSETGLDSLDLMELLDEVEEQFDIRVTDDSVSSETTVGDFIAFVEKKVAETSP